MIPNWRQVFIDKKYQLFLKPLETKLFQRRQKRLQPHRRQRPHPKARKQQDRRIIQCINRLGHQQIDDQQLPKIMCDRAAHGEYEYRRPAPEKAQDSHYAKRQQTAAEAQRAGHRTAGEQYKKAFEQNKRERAAAPQKEQRIHHNHICKTQLHARRQPQQRRERPKKKAPRTEQTEAPSTPRGASFHCAEHSPSFSGDMHEPLLQKDNMVSPLCFCCQFK